MTDGCASNTDSKSGQGCMNAPWLRTRFNMKLTRFQNSVVSYDKYIIIYGFNLHSPGLYIGPQPQIIYLNVETEQWHWPRNQPPAGMVYGWTPMKEKSKPYFYT